MKVLELAAVDFSGIVSPMLFRGTFSPEIEGQGNKELEILHLQTIKLMDKKSASEMGTLLGKYKNCVNPDIHLIMKILFIYNYTKSGEYNSFNQSLSDAETVADDVDAAEVAVVAAEAEAVVVKVVEAATPTLKAAAKAAEQDMEEGK